MSLPDFQLLHPRSLKDAVHMLEDNVPRAQVIAGGTDLIPSMKQRLFTPAHVIDIRGIEELRGIHTVPGGGVELRALTTISNIEDSGFVARNFPILQSAASSVASPILRNMGTLGGNLCLDTRCLWYNQSLQWRKSCGFCLKKDGMVCHVAPGSETCWAVYSGDMAPALLCLGAEVEIVGPLGFRRVPLAEFYGNDGIERIRLERFEILTRVIIPEESAGWKGSYQKLRLRGSIDYPQAGIAVTMKVKLGLVQQARVAITGVNPAPLLVPAAANALVGRPANEHYANVVGELAAQVAKPLTTSGFTPEYRREMVRVYAKRAVLAAAQS